MSHSTELASIRKRILELVSQMTLSQKVFFGAYKENPANLEEAARKTGCKHFLKETALEFLDHPVMAEAARLLDREHELRFNVTLDDIHHKLLGMAGEAHDDKIRIRALQILEARLAKADSRYNSTRAVEHTTEHKTKVLIGQAMQKVIEVEPDKPQQLQAPRRFEDMI